METNFLKPPESGRRRRREIFPSAMWLARLLRTVLLDKHSFYDREALAQWNIEVHISDKKNHNHDETSFCVPPWLPVAQDPDVVARQLKSARASIDFSNRYLSPLDIDRPRPNSLHPWNPPDLAGQFGGAAGSLDRAHPLPDDNALDASPPPERRLKCARARGPDYYDTFESTINRGQKLYHVDDRWAGYHIVPELWGVSRFLGDDEPLGIIGSDVWDRAIDEDNDVTVPLLRSELACMLGLICCQLRRRASRGAADVYAKPVVVSYHLENRDSIAIYEAARSGGGGKRPGMRGKPTFNEVNQD